MYVKITTMSGAEYQFDPLDLTWYRKNDENKPIYGLKNIRGTGIASGHLVEWPVIAIAKRIMFDDTEVGVVYTTPVIKAEVIWEGAENPE